MGLFGKVFGSNSEAKKSDDLPWVDINSEQELDKIKSDSQERAQIIFKHSTRCGVSRMVKNQFLGTYDIEPTKADLYHLDLIAHRNISNKISEMFEVRHESPQLIVIKNGEVIEHRSHGDILDLDLNNIV